MTTRGWNGNSSKQKNRTWSSRNRNDMDLFGTVDAAGKTHLNVCRPTRPGNEVDGPRKVC
jgi:hypothetical protein